jgi:hypothetical protein
LKITVVAQSTVQVATALAAHPPEVLVAVAVDVVAQLALVQHLKNSS